MPDVWFYAIDGKSVGPLTKAQLVDELSRMPRAEFALVWQSGLPDWRKALDFSELLPYVVKPPPLPPQPPPLPQRVSISPVDADARRGGEPSVSEVEAAQFKDVKKDPAGIAGWLAIVAIGQVLGPLRLLASLGQYYEKLDQRVVENFPVVVWGEAAMNAGLFLFVISTAVLFFRQSRKFPKLFIWQWVVVIALPFVDAAWIAVSMAAYTGRNAAEFLDIGAKEIGQSSAYCIVGGIWIAYILKSKRVANTFII